MSRLSTIILFTFSQCVLSAQEDIMLRLIESKEVEHGIVGVSLTDVSTGEEVFEYNSEKLMTPASSLKLITTFSALSELGSDFTFKTKLGYTGVIEPDGTLKGDVVIIGGGDPTLGAYRWEGAEIDLLLSDIVKEIKAEGVTCIDGGVIADHSIYQGQSIPDEWNWNDMGNYYGSGAWGLNINENQYQVVFDKNKTKGQRARFKYTVPRLSQLVIKSYVMTADSNTGDNAYIYGAPYQRYREIRGTIPQSKKDFFISGSLPNPPLAFAELVFKSLEKAKVKVAGDYIVDEVKKSHRPFAAYISEPLSIVASKANFHSINLYCDALLRALGHHNNGNGSVKKGIRNINSWLKSQKLDTDEIVIKDGSGLAAENKITPRFMTSFLSKMKIKFGKDILSYLPRVGHQGTVTSLMSGQKFASRFYLKSGSFKGVLSYSGFVKARSGKTYSVCVIVNDSSKGYGTMKRYLQKVLGGLYKNY